MVISWLALGETICYEWGMELKAEIKDYIKEITADCYADSSLLLNKLCEKLNLGLYETEFDNPKVSGQIEKNPDSNSFNIYINRNQSKNRQRFTTAHEIGHYISYKFDSHSKEQMEKDGYEDSILFRKDGETSDAETEANQIAAEMLMPAEQVEELLKESLLLEEMAEKFFVSPSAMAVRLQNLYPDLMLP